MKTALTVFAAAALLASGCQQDPVRSAGVPQFKVDPYWPKPLPSNWILGQVAGIAADREDRIWIVHRPATLVDDEKGALANPPSTKCCTPAPPVLRPCRERLILDADKLRKRHPAHPAAFKLIEQLFPARRRSLHPPQRVGLQNHFIRRCRIHRSAMLRPL